MEISPSPISKLKQLDDLILKNNQVTGPIPSTLSQISNLKNLVFIGDTSGINPGSTVRWRHYSQPASTTLFVKDVLQYSYSPHSSSGSMVHTCSLHHYLLGETVVATVGQLAAAMLVVGLHDKSFLYRSLKTNQLTGSIPSTLSQIL